MPEHDRILQGLAAFCQAHDLVVEKRGGGYSLLSGRTGAPVARLRPTEDPETDSSGRRNTAFVDLRQPLVKGPEVLHAPPPKAVEVHRARRVVDDAEDVQQG